MQSLEIKALELEDTAFRHLDGFVHEHSLYFLIGIIYLLLALLGWVLSGALRPKSGKPPSPIRPGIIIHLSGTPPPRPEPFNPFPVLHDSPDCDYDCDDVDWD